MAFGRTLKRLHLGRGAEADVLEGRSPLRPPGDEGEVSLDFGGNLARWRAQHRNLNPVLRQEPGCADQRVAREGELRPRREDAQLAPLPVLDENRLGEAEVRSDVLAVFLRHLAAFEEHAQGVASGTSFADEDLEHVQRRQEGSFRDPSSTLVDHHKHRAAALLLTLIHPSAWKNKHSRKSISKILPSPDIHP